MYYTRMGNPYQSITTFQHYHLSSCTYLSNHIQQIFTHFDLILYFNSKNVKTIRKYILQFQGILLTFNKIYCLRRNFSNSRQVRKHLEDFLEKGTSLIELE